MAAVDVNRFPGVVFLDSFSALFIVFVATCFYWRGSWDVISADVLPDDEPLNHWVRFAIGTCTSLTYFSLPLVRRALRGANKFTFIVGSRIFMIIHGALYMFIWRGLWGLADYYLGMDPRWGWATIAVCYSGLVVLGVSRQLMWPPYMVPNDDRPDLLIAANRFGVEPERRLKYYLDCLFTSVGINGLAILCWRSAWAIMDAYIYHGEPLKSDMFCVIFGFTGVVLFFIAQLRLADISKWFERTYPNMKLYRIIYEDSVYLFVYLTLILLWRGCWNMNIRYVITDPEIGGPVNHCLGLVALLLLRTFSIIAGCGCIRDGGEALGGAFFPIQYLYIYTNPRLFDKEAYMKSKEKGRIPSAKDSKLSGEINHGYSNNEAVTIATVSDTVVENYKF